MTPFYGQTSSWDLKSKHCSEEERTAKISAVVFDRNQKWMQFSRKSVLQFSQFLYMWLFQGHHFAGPAWAVRICAASAAWRCARNGVMLYSLVISLKTDARKIDLKIGWTWSDLDIENMLARCRTKPFVALVRHRKKTVSRWVHPAFRWRPLRLPEKVAPSFPIRWHFWDKLGVAWCNCWKRTQSAVRLTDIQDSSCWFKTAEVLDQK